MYMRRVAFRHGMALPLSLCSVWRGRSYLVQFQSLQPKREKTERERELEVFFFSFFLFFGVG